ncbi:MAG: manganese efflux pump [Planctomycetes bacterium]|nr:manganese efflux pump [Planctomycetota bacterium]
MTAPSILLLAIGLAMDATAVAAAQGISIPRVMPRQALLMASLFGGFQAMMPVVGWAVGERVGSVVERWDHWIAFGLLSAIGGTLLWKSFRGSASEEGASDGDAFELRVLLVLAVATSIDALAVGFTLPMLDAPFVATITTIGVVTALLSLCGLWAGRRFGGLLGPRLDALGGCVLIGLGTKILLEHLGA